MRYDSCFYRVRHGKAWWLASVLAIWLWISDISLALKPSTSSVSLKGGIEGIDGGEKNDRGKSKKCTVEDLLPLPSLEKSLEWTDETMTKPSYDCTCAAMKAR